MKHKMTFSRKAKRNITIVAWLVVIVLVILVRLISQVGNAVVMDATVDGSAFVQVERVPTLPEQIHDDPSAHSSIFISLTPTEIERPVDVGAGCFPLTIVSYETRTVAGKDLPGYTVSVTWYGETPHSLEIPAPFFRLSTASARTASRTMNLLGMRYKGHLHTANVGFLSPRWRDVPGWSMPKPEDFHLVTISVAKGDGKVYRWATFVPVPTYQKIVLWTHDIRAYALYRTPEQAKEAVLRLWDGEGGVETVKK